MSQIERAASTPDRWDEGPNLVQSLLRYRWVVLASALVAGLLGFIIAGLQPDVYEATAKLFLVEPGSQEELGATDRIDPERYVAQEVERLRSRETREGAARILGDGTTESDIRLSTEGASFPALNLISVVAQAETPERAAELANAVAQSYQQVSQARIDDEAAKATAELQRAQDTVTATINQLSQEARAQRAANPAAAPDLVLQARVDQQVTRLLELESRIESIALAAQVYNAGVDRFEEARAPLSRVAPNPLLTAILLAILGGAGGVAFAYYRAGRFTAVRSESDPEAVLGAPLLGTLRQMPSDKVAVDSQSAEAFQFVLASADFALARLGGSAIMVTSPVPVPRRQTVAFQLGLAAVRGGRQVVVVDGDLRSRRLSTMLEAESLAGLAELAQVERPVEDCVYTFWVDRDMPLPVVASGRMNQAHLRMLRSAGFEKAITAIKDSAELTIIDAPPLLDVADASMLANHVDGVVMVIPKGMTFAELLAVRDRLAFMAAPLLGYVYVDELPTGVEESPKLINLSSSQRRNDSAGTGNGSSQNFEAGNRAASA